MKHENLIFIRISILFNLSCFICDREEIFISFKHKNEHSVEQFTIGVHTQKYKL